MMKQCFNCGEWLEIEDTESSKVKAECVCGATNTFYKPEQSKEIFPERNLSVVGRY